MTDPPFSPVLGRLTKDAADEAARLIFTSLDVWYARKLNQPGRFGADWRPFRNFPLLYESLDPGCGITARHPVSGQLEGICFFHPRPTHYSLGIVATNPDGGGRGIARAMVDEALRLADAQGLPVRLVSSLMSLDSFSLYTRRGFVPHTIFQDLQLPPGHLLPETPESARVREAQPADIEAMVAMEMDLVGLDRRKDFHWFLSNRQQGWLSMVLVNPAGGLRGFLVLLQYGDTCMLGPGLARDEHAALDLLTAQLRHLAPANPVFLVPAQAKSLVTRLYQEGAKNLELHVSQIRGRGKPGSGVIFPTFMPETG